MTPQKVAIRTDSEYCAVSPQKDTSNELQLKITEKRTFAGGRASYFDLAIGRA